MVHRKRRLQELEGVEFIHVDLWKTYVSCPLFPLWLMVLRLYSRFGKECSQVRLNASRFSRSS